MRVLRGYEGGWGLPVALLTEGLWGIKLIERKVEPKGVRERVKKREREEEKKKKNKKE